MELISVIVPIYNVEKYIDQCVESIILQTYSDLEIILVDDGSTDSSKDKCDIWEKKDCRIRVIHKSNGGLSDARNAGIEVATGRYLMFIDGDDYISNDMVEKLYFAILNHSADISICGIQEVDESGNNIPNNAKLDDAVLTNIDALKRLSTPGYGYCVSACNKLYKKELFSKLRFPVGKLYEDMFSTHEFFFECKKIVFIPFKLYYAIIRAGSIQRSEKTIRHLDNIDAAFNRVMFYEENRLLELIPDAVSVLISVYFKQRFTINDHSIKAKKSFCKIKKKMRYAYKKYVKNKSIDVFIGIEMPWLYSLLTKMNFRGKIKKIVGK